MSSQLIQQEEIIKESEVKINTEAVAYENAAEQASVVVL